MMHRSICLPGFPAVSHVRRYSRQVSAVLRALDLFILPAFSAGDFFLTLSHRFLKLSDLLAQLGVLRITLLGPRQNLVCRSSFRDGRGADNKKLEAVMTMSAKRAFLRRGRNVPFCLLDPACDARVAEQVESDRGHLGI
jgi:hypothetical protein